MNLAGFGDWDWSIQAGDDDESTNDTGLPSHGSDALLFLIDCSPCMFEKKEGNDSNIGISTQCIQNVCRRKVISSASDLCAIMFYRLVDTDSGTQFAIYKTYQDLGQLNIKRVAELDELCVEAETFSRSNETVNKHDFSDVLWASSAVFSQCSKTLGFKRILMFTDDDSPHAADETILKKVCAKSTDLQEMGIELELLHMNPVGGVFDMDKFYKAVLYNSAELDGKICDPADRFNELLTMVRYKEYKRRALGRINWSIGGMQLSVGVYCLCRRAAKPPSVKIHRASNAEVKSATRVFNRDTGEDVMPQDLKMYQEYADKRVCLETEEVADIKRFDVQGLKLIGFKKSSAVSVNHHVKPSHFIYPDNQVVKGSSTLFSALLSRCIQRDMVALCWYSPRTNSTLELVQLRPQAEIKDEHGVQTTPAGFHVVIVPFKEDIREVDLPDDLPKASTDQVDKAKDMIKKLAFPFSPHLFENPSLQKYYANLEAMALNKDDVEEITDYTIPDIKRIAKRASAEINEFKQQLIPKDYTGPGAPKRSAKDSSSLPTKRPKTECSDLQEEARLGGLDKMTVASLKEGIKTYGIKSSGTKKAQLIEAIKLHFGV